MYANQWSIFIITNAMFRIIHAERMVGLTIKYYKDFCPIFSAQYLMNPLEIQLNVVQYNIDIEWNIRAPNHEIIHSIHRTDIEILLRVLLLSSIHSSKWNKWSEFHWWSLWMRYEVWGMEARKECEQFMQSSSI